ncbi:MAG: alpha/beta fold hydrolase [Deltaproteobacteria bacterium]|nr:alpha/beta fold hydrolase [Deltaproteobacteria bacterium]
MFVTIDSPFAEQPVALHVREAGAAAPQAPAIVHLHGGWGYEVYAAQRQIDALPELRWLIPDRTGYGKSPRLDELPRKFHLAAAIETEALLAALGIERCVLWGHSDGAVIAAICGLRRPERYDGLVLEALHLDRLKPLSREFFLQMAASPTDFGERISAILRADHGDTWEDVLRMGGRAWLEIAARARTATYDFFDERLAELAPRTLVLHGAEDPRTEPGELDAIRAALPRATFTVLAGGGHCPHAERRVADAVTAALRAFLLDA